MTLRALGLMSGTSMDGIDAALIETDGEQNIRFVESHSMSYPSQFHRLLKATEHYIHTQNGLYHKDDNIPGFIKTIQDVIEESTIYHINLIKKFTHKIDLIGYHGQTFFHKPELNRSIILGNPQKIANELSYPVIFDFRSNDLNHGGKGAPLAPIYHKALLQKPCVVVNCGGISNVTIIQDDNLIAFDVGPGNVLIDRLVRQKTNFTCDQDGMFGLKGQIHHHLKPLLWERSCIKGDNYYDILPPKALDSHDFILIPEIFDLSIEDACATLEDFTAYVLSKSIQLIGNKAPSLWVLAGGGWNNPMILKRLRFYLHNFEIKTADELDLRSDSMEAELFAYLATRSIKGLPLSFPQTTGVPFPVSGGKTFKPNLQL